MERVLVVGCSAAGKSTVARELGKILDISVVHLDKLLWKPGCRLSDAHEEPEAVREVLDQPRWIMDGNYTVSLPMRLAAADTVVVVDFDRWRCLYRAMKRLLQFRGRTRPDMGAQCPEQLNLSFLQWIWNYPHDERPVLLKQLREHGGHAKLVFLHNPREVDRFLERVRRGSKTHGEPHAAGAN